MPSDATQDAARPRAESGAPNHFGALWFGLLGGPLVWGAQFLAQSLLVGWTCAHGTRIPLHVAVVAGAAVSALSAVVAFKLWNEFGRTAPDDEGGPTPRARFMAVLGVLTGAIFTLIIIAQGVPGFIIGPCQ